MHEGAGHERMWRRTQGVDHDPARPEPVGDAGDAAPARDQAAALRVLVLDDDAVDRIAVRRCLARGPLPVEVSEAETVLEAIEQLTRAPFDCVVLDYNLPDGDGLTFLRGMRAAGLAVPVIALSGQPDADVARQLVSAGAVAYLPKDGLNPALLAASLREAASLR